MSYNKQKVDSDLGQKIHEHLIACGVETPAVATSSTRSEKINSIESHFSEIMKELGLDLKNDSLRETPKRVAKMFVNLIFQYWSKGRSIWFDHVVKTSFVSKP